jgi:hypothetical protein
MRKTWTSLLVAVAMVLGLCACGGSTGDGEHEATAPMTAASASAPARESDTGSYSEVAKLGLVGMAWTDARKILNHAHITRASTRLRLRMENSLEEVQLDRQISVG